MLQQIPDNVVEVANPALVARLRLMGVAVGK